MDVIRVKVVHRTTKKKIVQLINVCAHDANGTAEVQRNTRKKTLDVCVPKESKDPPDFSGGGSVQSRNSAPWGEGRRCPQIP